MPHPEWFPRRVKRPLAAAAAGTLVAIAGAVILAAGPGRATLRPLSVHGQGGRPAAAPVGPLRVLSVSPAAGARDVNGATPVRVFFSAPLAAGSPMPELSPAIPGRWRLDGRSAVFTPATGIAEDTHVVLTVPGGPAGVRSIAGGGKRNESRLASSVTGSFTTAPFSTLRLQQLLAQLGYLPLTWTPSGAPIPPADSAAQAAAAYSPPPGTLTWQQGYPAALRSIWQQGSPNLIDTGAIRAFESDWGLTMDGTAGPQVWSALLRAAATGRQNTNGYTYALASKASPETLSIWHDGREVFHSLANTGIAASPTAGGTFPVYERLRSQVMQGTNPDGSHYADPVQYVAYFNGGDAVHYIPRASYGWPQSLGCVELPLAQAAAAWGYLTYGSLVTVTG